MLLLSEEEGTGEMPEGAGGEGAHLSNTGEGPEGIPTLEGVPIVQLEAELPFLGLFYLIRLFLDSKRDPPPGGGCRALRAFQG